MSRPSAALALHAHHRATGRLRAAGIPEERIAAFLALAVRAALDARVDTAARLGRCTYAGTWDTSNGDEVWAIIRDGRVVTLMLRRSTQPRTPQSMSVVRVVAAA